jgi:hypothetical protein
MMGVVVGIGVMVAVVVAVVVGVGVTGGVTGWVHPATRMAARQRIATVPKIFNFCIFYLREIWGGEEIYVSRCDLKEILEGYLSGH